MNQIQQFKAEVLQPAEVRMKEFGLDVKRIKQETSMALQIVNDPKNKLLRECTPNSLMTSVVNIASVNLTLNPISKEAYLIPRYNKVIKKFECHLEPSYIGLLKLVTDAGSVTSIQTNLVYENDEFSIIYGLHTDFRHVPVTKGDRGKIAGVYSVATLKSSEKIFEYMNREEIEKIRNVSESYRAFSEDKIKTCIWVEHEGEMFRKTCLKRIQKYLPRTSQMGYVDKAVQLSNSDWEASPGQVAMAESLINTSTLLDPQKEDLYRQLQTSKSYDVEMMIEYLRDCQHSKIEAGENYNQGDIQKELDKIDNDPSK